MDKAYPLLPFELYNIGDFLDGRNYPNAWHPESIKYKQYWKEEAGKCIYGVWGDDSRIHSGKKIGGNRWMPGNLKFYMTYQKIPSSIDGEPLARGRSEFPKLRDVEWCIFYDLAVTSGFAGWKDDGKFTSVYLVDKMEQDFPLTEMEKKLFEKYERFLLNKKGLLKKYVDPMEALYMTYDEPLGDPLWLNPAENYSLTTTRRLGKSASIISGVAVYNFTFNGAKTLEQYLNHITNTATVVGSGNSSKTKEFFDKFDAAYDYLRTGPGYHRESNGVFWMPYEGSIAKENNFITNRIKEEGGVGEVGAGSKMVHVSYMRNASAGAGYAADDNIVEESGLTPNIEAVHGENTPSQMSDIIKFGRSIYMGTGGDMEKVKGIKKIHSSPGAFSLLKCKNPYSGKPKITGRFIPTYFYQDYRDENGNQDYKKAFKDEMTFRKSLESEDAERYIRHKASHPIKDEEMFMQIEGNVFPTAKLERRQNELDVNPLQTSIGNLHFIDAYNSEVSWGEDFDLLPFNKMEDLERRWPKEGGIVVYEHPVGYMPSRRLENPMYLTFYEPVRNQTGSSWVHAYVFKFYDYANPAALQFNIAAEWFGRYDINDNNHQMLFKLAAYYNSMIFPEINNDDIISYARRVKKIDWIHPEIKKLEGLEIEGRKDHRYGFYVLPGMIPSLENLLRELLLRLMDRSESIVGDKIIRKDITFAETINSSMGVDQLINYNRNYNFDAVSSLFLLAVYDKAMMKPDEQYMNKEADRELSIAMATIIKSRRTLSTVRR